MGMMIDAQKAVQDGIEEDSAIEIADDFATLTMARTKIDKTKAGVQNDAKIDTDVILAPREVDFVPPLVRSFSTLFSLQGKEASPSAINSALGNDVASPVLCQRAVKQLGLTTRIVHKETLTEINNAVLPAILLLQNQQSCILVEKKEEEVVVIFPELGDTSSIVPLDVIEDVYTGYAIFASLDPVVDKHLNSIVKLDTKRWFWDVILHYIPIYRQVVFASIAINMLALIGPLFFMNVYDRVVPNLAYDTLWVLAVGVFVGYLFEFILRILRSNFTDRANRNISAIITTRLMQKILQMRLEDRPDSSGALVNHMKEFESLQDFFSAVSLLTIIDLPFLVLFLLIVLFIGGPVVFLPIVAIILLICVVLFMQYAVRKNSVLNHQTNVEKNAHLVEMVGGIEAIKMAGAENRMLQIWEKITAYSATVMQNSKSTTTLAVSLASFISHFVSVSLIVWGVYLIGNNQLTMGGLIACNILISRSMSFIMQVAALMTRYQQAKVSLEVLNKLMDLPAERHTSTHLVEFKELKHSLELSRVSFSYKDTHLPAVDNISLTIQPGEKVGIIGNMGSGKSTLSRLFCGLYTPTQGAVKFGGVDLRRLDISEFRTRVSFLSQDPLLFHGTIRENIALGSQHIPDQLVARAAWIAGVHDFVQNMPEGYAKHVTEKGQNLSGGQRQSIALARALLHDPDVLILDEPTNNIDGITESRIKNRLKQVSEKKTLIINMHRMSLLDLTTRLIVLQNGKIIADGPTEKVYSWLRGEKLQDPSEVVVEQSNEADDVSDENNSPEEANTSEA